MSRNITLEKHSKAKRLGSSHSPAPQFWKGPLNFGKVSVPPKNCSFEGVKKNFGPPKKDSTREMDVTCAFCKKKWKKSVKFGLGGRSNISLPRIGGSHPVPSLSLLLTERRGYSNVLPPHNLIITISLSSSLRHHLVITILPSQSHHITISPSPSLRHNLAFTISPIPSCSARLAVTTFQTSDLLGNMADQNAA